MISVGGVITLDGMKIEETEHKHYFIIINYFHIKLEDLINKKSQWKVMRLIFFIARFKGS